MGNLWGQMRAAADADREDRVKAGERAERLGRADLLRVVERKLKTSFIGALSQFEQRFGHLWGHNLPDNRLTQAQRDMRPVWDEVRRAVLTNGNNQVRAAEQEFQLFAIRRLPFEAEFKPVEDGQ